MSTNILDLPMELYNYIFQFLNALDVYIFISPTCSLFQKLVYSGKLPCLTKLTLEPSHTFVDYPHSPIGFKGELTDEILMTFARTSGKFLKRLTLKMTSHSNGSERVCRRNLTDKSIKYFFSKAVNIEKIELVDITIRDFETIKELANLEHLNTLVFSTCRFKFNTEIKEPLVPLYNLKKLKIKGCDGYIGKFLMLEKLEDLYVQNEDDFPAGSGGDHMPCLTHLFLEKYGRHDYKQFNAGVISKKFPNIEFLSMRRCTLDSILKKPFHNLYYLEIAVDKNYEYLFEGETKLFPKLRDLKIASYCRYDNTNKFSRKVFCNLPTMYPDLESLEIRNSTDISGQDVEETLRKLRKLRSARFPHCRNVLSLPLVQTLIQSCPSLTVLELGWPGGGKALEAQASFQAGEIIEILMKEYVSKLDCLILRGFPPVYYHQLSTYRKIELIPKELPLVYLKEANNRLYYNMDDENYKVSCGCGKDVDAVEYSQKHQFVCPAGRMRKLVEDEETYLTCKTCGLENIKKKNYERHIILHEEHVCFNGGWSCKCTDCSDYVLRKKENQTESLDQHLQSCEKMIVMCHGCGKEITYSQYDFHIENECAEM